MKLVIKCDKKLSKEFRDLAEKAVRDIVELGKNRGIQDGDRTRVICDKNEGEDFFVLQFCKVYGTFNTATNPFAHGTATIEAT